MFSRDYRACIVLSTLALYIPQTAWLELFVSCPLRCRLVAAPAAAAPHQKDIRKGWDDLAQTKDRVDQTAQDVAFLRAELQLVFFASGSACAALAAELADYTAGKAAVASGTSKTLQKASATLQLNVFASKGRC